jgi:hypothetical protein
MATKKTTTKKVETKSTSKSTKTTVKKSATKVPVTAEELINAIKVMRKPNGPLSKLTPKELSEALLKGLWKSWKVKKLSSYGYSVVYKKGTEEVVLRIDRSSDSSMGYAKVTYCVVVG